MRKHLYTFFFLFIFSITTNAQSWKPFYKGDTVNYKYGDSTEYVINTLWIDSVKVVNGDSVFYMNRIVTDCDTCSHILPHCDTCYALTNQPQFLMRSIVKKPGGFYLLKDTAKYYLKVNAILNESWVFDSLHNINANISSVGQENVLGQLDSVKIISLSNGRSIKFSKNNGIIDFPDFKTAGKNHSIIGIENRNTGYHVPKWLDYFSHIEINDVLVYAGYYSQAAPTWGWKDYTIYKTISSKILGNDKITFVYTYVEYWHGWGGQGINYGGGCFEILKSDYPNFYNSQIVEARLRFPCSMTGPYYSKVIVTNQRKYIAQFYQKIPNSIVLQKTPSYIAYKSVVKLGIGEYENVDRGLEYYGDYRFIAHSHVDITEENLSDKKFTIYPNPGQGNIIITSNADICASGYNIVIYDQLGKQYYVKENIVSEKMEIDLTSLNKGLYLCIISNSNKEVLEKIKLLIQ